MKQRIIGLVCAIGLLLPVSAGASSNDMIAGGCTTRVMCSQKIMASDLRGVYTSHGFSAASFKQSAVSGTVTKSGEVMVNGRLVATGAHSFGRQFVSGSTKAGPVFSRPTADVFQQNSLGAFVMMAGGHFQFAILTSCGNLVTATPKMMAKPTPKPIATPAPAPTVVNVTQTQTQSQTQSQAPTPAPAPVVKAAATPTPAPALPQTGASTTLGVAGLSLLATLMWYYYRGRRDLRLALRRVSLGR